MRKKLGVKKKRWSKRISPEVYPLYEKVREAMFCLKKDDQILSYECKGQILNNSAVVFEFSFLFWTKIISICVYQTEKPDGCNLIETKEKNFDLVVGKDTSSKQIYEEFKIRSIIANSGGKFERNIIQNISEYFEETKSEYKIRKSTDEVDENDKIDFWVSKGSREVGIQLKTGLPFFWKEHQRKYQQVPSLFCGNKKVKIADIVQVLIFIFKRKIDDNYSEHVNLEKFLKKKTSYE